MGDLNIFLGKDLNLGKSWHTSEPPWFALQFIYDSLFLILIICNHQQVNKTFYNWSITLNSLETQYQGPLFVGKCPLFVYTICRAYWFFKSIQHICTAWKVSKDGVIFGLNTGKYGPEITPYLNTFCAVYTSWTHDVKWVYIRRSEPFHSFFFNVLCTFNLRPLSRGSTVTTLLVLLISHYLKWISFHLFFPSFFARILCRF